MQLGDGNELSKMSILIFWREVARPDAPDFVNCSIFHEELSLYRHLFASVQSSSPKDCVRITSYLCMFWFLCQDHREFLPPFARIRKFNSKIEITRFLVTKTNLRRNRLKGRDYEERA